MNTRILPLALVASLAACDASPVEPDIARSEITVTFGSGLRDGDADGSASTISSFLGTGSRTEATGSATTSSAYAGSGNREGEPVEDEAGASTSSVYLGSGNRDGEPAEEDSPLLGGGGR